MSISFSALTLIGAFTLSLFLGILNFWFWRAQREDRTPLWMAAWLSASAIFTLCRLLQYASLSQPMYILVPRILLSFAYSLAWIGYELGNSFIGYRLPRWERTLIIILVVVPIIFLWTGDLILTDQIMVRTVAFDGKFTGVQTGILYLPASILILIIGGIPVVRLARASNSRKRENQLMAAGLLFIIIFSLFDFIATALGLVWIRFTDFSYLPAAIVFSYIQVERLGGLYGEMNLRVRERTAELSQANEALRVEITERERAEAEILNRTETVTALYETTRDLSVEHDLPNLLQTIVERAVRLLDAEGGGLYLCEPEKDQVRCVVSYNTLVDYTGTVLKYGEGSAGRVAQTGEPLVIDDYSTWEGRAAVYDDDTKPFRAVLSVPIKWQEDIIGVLHALESTRKRQFTPADLQLITSFANQAAVAVQNANLYAQVNQELAERKRAEAALLESREQLSKVFEAAMDGIISIDLNQRILLFNTAAEKMFGYKAEEIMGQSLDIILPERYRAAHAGHIENFDKTGITNRHMIGFGEVTGLRKSGEEFPLEASISKVELGGQKVFTVILRDITDRKQAEDALRESEARFSTAFFTSPVSQSIFTREKNEIIAVNDACCRLFGYSREELIGVSTAKLNLWENPAEQLVAVEELQQTGHLLPRETTVRVKSGETCTVIVAIEPITWKGTPCLISSVFDISERKQAEEEIHRRADEMAALAEVSRDISSTLEFEVVLERIADYAKDLLNAETGAVYLYMPVESNLRAIAAIGLDAEDIKQEPLKIGKGILGKIAAQKVGEIVNDTSSDPRSIIVKGTEKLSHEHLMGVPVLAEDHLTGLIAVWRSGIGNEFISSDLEFLRSLAEQVAVAIENARLFEAEQKRRQEADTLREAAQRITSTLNQEQAIQLILEQLAKVVQFESASIQLLRDEYLEIVGGQGWADPSEVLGVRFPIPGDNPNTIVVLERRAVILENAPEKYPNFNNPPHHPILSWLGVPLIARDRVIGMFSVDHGQPDFFTDEHVHMVSAFAAQAATAIENARLFENTQRRLAEIEAVYTVSTALRSAQSLDEAMPIILDRLMDVAKAGSALIELIDPSSGEIVTELAHGVWTPVTGMRTPLDVGVSGHVISTGQPYVTTDLIKDGFIVRPDLVGGLNAAACVPIMAQHEPIGTLWIGRKSPILGEEVNLLAAVGEMVGNAIHRMRLHEQTEHLLADLKGANRDLSQAYETTLEGWAKALELRDKETEGHSRRVTELTLRLARSMGISEPELTHIHRGVLLHDIGKMGVADQLLRKTGPLTDEEWMEMRKHPEYAYDLLYPISYLRPVLDIPYCHHEKWDGTGYPRGLKGNKIPLAARIFAIVDVYDALAYDRPYRPAWPRQKVLDYLLEQSGKHFDPQVVEAFLGLLQDKRL